MTSAKPPTNAGVYLIESPLAAPPAVGQIVDFVDFVDFVDLVDRMDERTGSLQDDCRLVLTHDQSEGPSG